MRHITQQITSTKNQRVKDVMQLAKGRKRKSMGLFGVEGEREISRALRSGFEPVEMFVCVEMLSPELSAELDAAVERFRMQAFGISRDVFSKLAIREDSGGAFVIFQDRAVRLSSLKLPENPLIVAVEGIEKPGNLGALLRSADGAGADAVVVLDTSLDIYNPNVIRSSLGTVFSNQVCTATSQEFFDFCREQQVATYAAALTDRTQSYDTQDFTKASALILGSEAHGLTTYWIENAGTVIKIPMLGIADSLNVAMAGSILLYEARRQRK